MADHLTGAHFEEKEKLDGNRASVRTKTHEGEKMALTLEMLQKASYRLPAFIKSIRTTRPGLIRAMRPERQNSMIRLLRAMLQSCSLQHDGAICQIYEKWAKPKTIEELADQAGISYSQATRCMAELRAREYITSKQIKWKSGINGQVEVNLSLRFFTSKFWQDLGF